MNAVAASQVALVEAQLQLTATFVRALVITLREGMEMALIISAFAYYTEQVGMRQRLPALYAGAAAGLTASLFVVLIVDELARWTFVGVLLLVAAILMMAYVSFWFLIHAPHKRADKKVDLALAEGTTLAVVLLAFYTTLREGVEAVIFASALALAVGGWRPELLAGLACGLLGAITFGVFANRIKDHVSVRVLFLATSAIMLVMAGSLLFDLIN